MFETRAIGLETDPVVLGPRWKYDEVVARIVAGGGEWVRIRPDELSGTHVVAKQTVLRQAGRYRRLKIATSYRLAGWICARLVKVDEAVAW